MEDEFDDNGEAELMFWAYRHVNGNIQVKRFTSQDAVNDAYDSDFVDDVLDPYRATDRMDAESIAKQRLSKDN